MNKYKVKGLKWILNILTGLVLLYNKICNIHNITDQRYVD